MALTPHLGVQLGTLTSHGRRNITHSDGTADRRPEAARSHALRCSHAAADCQHSGTLTANPPREVSRYFECISRPVCRIVSTAWSRETRWVPSPCSAREAALIALTAPKALRSMHGICTNPPIGSHVIPR